VATWKIIFHNRKPGENNSAWQNSSRLGFGKRLPIQNKDSVPTIQQKDGKGAVFPVGEKSFERETQKNGVPAITANDNDIIMGDPPNIVEDSRGNIKKRDEGGGALFIREKLYGKKEEEEEELYDLALYGNETKIGCPVHLHVPHMHFGLTNIKLWLVSLNELARSLHATFSVGSMYSSFFFFCILV